ncbi:LysR family transcriptional regulator [Orbus hercynius]|uniref:LysR family transcriptional regulator n=1 Tax=Orbus hercynius TaxID=593135 RepID=A0A495RK77_9GAMM|nr:LysR family transcriptional regulator [Orbus hercynius]RKS87566.1 LysR family transcriptional regulator [Orbus hercynius]
MLENLNDLRAFVMIANTGSFTKAAGQLGVAQSALSYTIKTLEQRLAIQLFTRTTRSVSLTPAGEQLFNDIDPLIMALDQKITKLNHFRDTPHGKLRINGTEHAINILLWDKLAAFAKNFPHIQLEITTDYARSDIVKDRYDIGIRLGNHVAQDMIAKQITEPLQMITVASPDYLHKYGIPQTPLELYQHRCISMRLPSNEKVMAWDLTDVTASTSSHKNLLHFNPNFAIVLSNARLKVKAAIDGLGITWLPKTMINDEIEKEQLIELLPNWRTTYPPYYLYYPNRSESQPLLRLLIDALCQVQTKTRS